MDRQGKERDAPAHRLPLGGGDFDPAADKSGDLFAVAQAVEVGGRGFQLPVSCAVEGDRQVDGSARRGAGRQIRRKAAIADGGVHRRPRPAVKGHMRKGGAHQPFTRVSEVVGFGFCLVVHIALPRWTGRVPLCI